jgi:hypothetical protein
VLKRRRDQIGADAADVHAEPPPSAARMRAAAERSFVSATDLADWLVRVRGLPFRRAHHVAGAIVKAAEAQGCVLEALPLAAMQAIEPAITANVFDVLGVEASVRSRTSEGGTAPERVRAAVVGVAFSTEAPVGVTPAGERSQYFLYHVNRNCGIYESWREMRHRFDPAAGLAPVCGGRRPRRVR